METEIIQDKIKNMISEILEKSNRLHKRVIHSKTLDNADKVMILTELQDITDIMDDIPSYKTENILLLAGLTYEYEYLLKSIESLGEM